MKNRFYKFSTLNILLFIFVFFEGNSILHGCPKLELELDVVSNIYNVNNNVNESLCFIAVQSDYIQQFNKEEVYEENQSNQGTSINTLKSYKLINNFPSIKFFYLRFHFVIELI